MLKIPHYTRIIEHDVMIMGKNKYTQRQWDRTVGYGKVPDKYSVEKKDEDDEQEDRSVDEKSDD